MDSIDNATTIPLQQVPSSFTYESIVDGEIRVLELEPSDDPSAGLRGRLVRETLNGNEPYDTLSYTWGQEPANILITLNDSTFNIRGNLSQALRRLRFADRPRRMWVDAICIDQSKIEERNSQVAQMRDIYASAAHLAIWLGDDPDGIGAAAIQSIPELVSIFRNRDEAEVEYTLRSLLDHGNKQFARDIYNIAIFMERPWWHRVWIIQEVVFSSESDSEPIIYCGSSQITLSAVHDLATAVISSDALFLLSKVDSPPAKIARLAMMVLRSNFKLSMVLQIAKSSLGRLGKMNENLSYLIKLTSSHKATDPRDKVFAILGLIEPPLGLRPDYFLSIREVNILTMSRILTQDQDLRSFSFIAGVTDRDSELPSWVYNICEGEGTAQPISLGIGGYRTLYSADSRSSSELRQHTTIEFEENGQILRLQSIAIDHIAVLGQPAPSHSSGVFDGSDASIRHVLENWRNIAHGSEGLRAGKVNYAKIPCREIFISISKVVSNTNAFRYFIKKRTQDSRDETFWRTALTDSQRFWFSGDQTIHEPRRRYQDGSLPIPPKTAAEEKRLIKEMSSHDGEFFERRFTITTNGRMGLVPKSSQVGDKICFLLGGEVPFVLRRLEGDYYKLIGECYIHGIMDGEAIEGVKKGLFSFQDIRIK